jgi:hypothetical protein
MDDQLDEDDVELDVDVDDPLAMLEEVVEDHNTEIIARTSNPVASNRRRLCIALPLDEGLLQRLSIGRDEEQESEKELIDPPPPGVFSHGQVDTRDKMSLSRNFLDAIVESKANTPWLFEVSRVEGVTAPRVSLIHDDDDDDECYHQDCVVGEAIDFLSPINYAFLPTWMVKLLGLQPFDVVDVRLVIDLPTGLESSQSATSESDSCAKGVPTDKTTTPNANTAVNPDEGERNNWRKSVYHSVLNAEQLKWQSSVYTHVLNAENNRSTPKSGAYESPILAETSLSSPADALAPSYENAEQVEWQTSVYTHILNAENNRTTPQSDPDEESPLPAETALPSPPAPALAPSYENAVKLLLKAAHAYTIGGFNVEAGQAYQRADALYKDKLHNKVEASRCFVKANEFLKGSHPNETSKSNQLAVFLCGENEGDKSDVKERQYSDVMDENL